jgi:hypothetical protein
MEDILQGYGGLVTPRFHGGGYHQTYEVAMVKSFRL